MTKILLFVSVLLSHISYAQAKFEGSVMYKSEFKNLNPKAIADSVFVTRIKQALAGQTYMLQKYLYKEKNYKSEVKIGQHTTTQLYSHTDARLYTWQSNQDTATYVMANENDDKIKEIRPIEGEYEVMGIKCKKLFIISPKNVTCYWYNPEKYKISYDDYKTHTQGQWNEYLKIAGALPIKFETKTATFHIVSTAIEIKENKLNEADFRLPNFKKVSKNIRK
jgi:hypothetical protein